MNRAEFIESCRTLSEEQLYEIAAKSREAAEKRLPAEIVKQFRTLDDVTSVQEMQIDTSFGRTHIFLVSETDRRSELLPVVINIHGGGWTAAHGERDLYFCRRIASRLHALIVDIDYVLAPEHPYPAAIEEIEAFFNVLPRHLKEWGGDPENVILCGQSAGGNLAGAVTQRKRFSPDLKIKAQILCYLPTDNYNDHFHGGELDERGKSTEYYGFFYNRSFEERKNSDVSLLFADEEDLRGLPPTDILTCRMDNLCEEGEAYARKLAEANIAVTLRRFENSRHGFLINLMDEWKDGEDYVVSLIENHLKN